jgi:hypothetical protein
MAAVKAKKPTTKLKSSKSKPLNKWVLIGGVAAVALVGALIVRISGASGVVRTASQLVNMSADATTSKNNKLITDKPVDNTTYARVKSSDIREFNYEPGTLFSKSELSAAKSICADVYNAHSASVNFQIAQLPGGRWGNLIVPSKSKRTVCVFNPARVNSSITVYSYPSNTTAKAWVKSIYVKN